MVSVRVPVFYSQLAVFAYGMSSPFNDWEEQHVRQGFTWREGSVSFAVPGFVSEVDLEVTLGRNTAPSRSMRRAIVVPFHVAGGCGVEVGSIAQTFEVEIPDGEYGLLFELAYEHGSDLAGARFSFAEKCDAPRIIENDSTLSAVGGFLMRASPA